MEGQAEHPQEALGDQDLDAMQGEEKDYRFGQDESHTALPL